jgi:hypothetical protein
MKVKLDVSPDTVITCETDAEDNVISVTFEPMFTKKAGQAVLAYGTALKDSGKKIEEFALVVSGTTGKVTKTARNEPVKAKIDDDEKPEATKPPAPK